jgi:hypothetical protein
VKHARLVGAGLVEAHDEWQAGEHPYLSEGSMPCSPLPAKHADNTERDATG